MINVTIAEQLDSASISLLAGTVRAARQFVEVCGCRSGREWWGTLRASSRGKAVERSSFTGSITRKTARD